MGNCKHNDLIGKIESGKIPIGIGAGKNWCFQCKKMVTITTQDIDSYRERQRTQRKSFTEEKRSSD